ncbi:MAG: hypothetical protein HY878_03390 [Deltaproteobacteria bacterium]|nr:hypothetical protein [Deltaproteobacteria bacterium]
MATIRKRWLIYLLSSFILALALLFAYLLFVPIDLTRYQTWVLPKIEERVSGKVFVSRVVLEVLPFPRILLEGVEVKDGEETVFTSEAIRLIFFLEPLLERRVEVKELVLERPVLLVKRGQDGQLKLIQFKKGRDFFPATVISIKVKDGKVEFVDDLQEKRYQVQGLVFLLEPKWSTLSYKGE